MANPRLCSIPNCGKPKHKGGLCSAHSKRLMRHNSLEPLVSRKGAKHEWLCEHVDYDGDGCLIFPFKLSPKGRGVFTLDGNKIFASVFMCELVHGPRPSPRHEAAHSCGKGHEGCVHPKHLRWATFEENKADMVTHGTAMRGENHRLHKLTEDQAREIRAAKGKLSRAYLASHYGVSTSTVDAIHAGRNWGWVPQD
ncbi:hypothetical protein M2267_003034 [Ensifer sp. KUDG1]|uniref:hypothetical protein n=1 Tax=Ensifer sp. KUDG1 TaxID=3373919 RepID=UPI003D1F3658